MVADASRGHLAYAQDLDQIYFQSTESVKDRFVFYNVLSYAKLCANQYSNMHRDHRQRRRQFHHRYTP